MPSGTPQLLQWTEPQTPSRETWLQIQALSFLGCLRLSFPICKVGMKNAYLTAGLWDLKENAHTVGIVSATSLSSVPGLGAQTGQLCPW